MDLSASIFTYALIIGAALFVFYWKTGRFIKCVLFSASTGVSALGIIWIAGRFFAITVSITPLSLAGSVFLGAPGVITMLILNLI